MTIVQKPADFRRPLTINLASAAGASSCENCGARHRGMCDVLSEDELSLLAKAAQRVTVKPDTVFIEEGEAAGYFYNVNHGVIRLFKSLPDGRRQITGFAGPGHFLGFTGTAKNIFSAETIEATKLCRFSRASLNEMFAEFPALERKLLDMAMHELVLVQQQMLLLGRKTAAERVASFLLAWAERLENCAPGRLPVSGTVLNLPLMRTDLADYLGITIETVSRTLSQLKRDGLIELPTIHDIVLLKPQALWNIAEAAG